MKRCLQRMLVLAVVLMAWGEVNAYDIILNYDEKSGGQNLYFNILSEENKTVELTYCYQKVWNDYFNDWAYETDSYRDTVCIPEKIYKYQSSGGTVYYSADNYYNSVAIYNVIKIGDYAFTGPNSATINEDTVSVLIPSSITEIGDSALACPAKILHDSNLSNITSIGKYGLSNSSFDDYTLSLSLNHISEGAFDNCQGLKQVTIENPECVIDRAAFAGVGPRTTDVVKVRINHIGEIVAIGEYS